MEDSRLETTLGWNLSTFVSFQTRIYRGGRGKRQMLADKTLAAKYGPMQSSV